MAQFTDTHDRYDLSTTGDNVRESLADVIYNISPTETPFVSNAGRGKSSSDYKEWLVDSLAAVDTSNAFVDGDEFVADSLNAAERLGNYHQISKKQIVVSRRANKLTKAGRKAEISYQLSKVGDELKRDIEAIAMGNQAAVAGSAGVAPLTASLGAWIKTNSFRGATGTDPTLSSTTYGYPDAAAGAGTNTALSEANLLGIIKDCYLEGGNPSVVMMHPTVKQLFSNYMFGSSARIATPYQDHGKNPRGGVTAVGAVDVYVSDFGTLDVVPNRFQGTDEVWLLDMEYWDLSYIDSFLVEEISKTGDATKRHIISDWSICSKNEAASGVVADVDSTTAMVA